MRTLLLFAVLQGAAMTSREARPLWVTLVAIVVLLAVMVLCIRLALRGEQRGPQDPFDPF